jgi:sterol desaturase/sphingolipid hydroxylase (fatty acid hydroxylase superfamily)
VNRVRVVKLWPYATAVGVLILFVSVFIAIEWQAAWDLGSRAVAFVQAKWRALSIVFITVLALIIEVFFLSWEKTTVFRLCVQRSKSAFVDLGFTLLTFSGYKWVVEYVFTLGAAYAAVKLGDSLAARIGWMRWELPSDGLLEVAGAFAVYFLISTFVGYWQHRLMHWRWFWYLHRFHHAAPDYNIFTAYRINPAEMISNLIPALSPLVFLKAPDAGLFLGFVMASQVIGAFQHSELPWTFGWFGRWFMVSPQNHQIHHSIDEEHRDKNFSNCPLWDRLFGTWYSGPNLPSAYGIPDQAHIDRPLTQWLRDIWIFYREVTLALAGSAQRGRNRIVRGKPPAPQATTPVSTPAE